MSSQPTDKEIIEAIQQSGYLMEQNIASSIEALDYHVETNYAFQDLDESISRELDVRAIKKITLNEEKEIYLFVELLCECKNNQNPFVFIGRKKNKKDAHPDPKEYIFPHQKYSRLFKKNGYEMVQLIPAFQRLELNDHHYYYATKEKAVQFCKIIRKGKNWTASHAGTYDSLLLPMAKALQVRSKEVKKINNQTNKEKYIWLFFPIIVLNSDIFYLDSHKEEIALENKKFVTFVRDLDAENIKGTFVVDFVTADYVAEFISNNIEKFTQRLAEIATNNPEFIINSAS